MEISVNNREIRQTKSAASPENEITVEGKMSVAKEGGSYLGVNIRDVKSLLASLAQSQGRVPQPLTDRQQKLSRHLETIERKEARPVKDTAGESSGRQLSSLITRIVGKYPEINQELSSALNRETLSVQSGDRLAAEISRNLANMPKILQADTTAGKSLLEFVAQAAVAKLDEKSLSENWKKQISDSNLAVVKNTSPREQQEISRILDDSVKFIYKNQGNALKSNSGDSLLNAITGSVSRNAQFSSVQTAPVKPAESSHVTYLNLFSQIANAKSTPEVSADLLQKINNIIIKAAQLAIESNLIEPPSDALDQIIEEEDFSLQDLKFVNSLITKAASGAGSQPVSKTSLMHASDINLTQKNVSSAAKELTEGEINAEIKRHMDIIHNSNDLKTIESTLQKINDLNKQLASIRAQNVIAQATRPDRAVQGAKNESAPSVQPSGDNISAQSQISKEAGQAAPAAQHQSGTAALRTNTVQTVSEGEITRPNTPGTGTVSESSSESGEKNPPRLISGSDGQIKADIQSGQDSAGKNLRIPSGQIKTDIQSGQDSAGKNLRVPAGQDAVQQNPRQNPQMSVIQQTTVLTVRNSANPSAPQTGIQGEVLSKNQIRTEVPQMQNTEGNETTKASDRGSLQSDPNRLNPKAHSPENQISSAAESGGNKQGAKSQPLSDESVRSTQGAVQQKTDSQVTRQQGSSVQPEPSSVNAAKDSSAATVSAGKDVSNPASNVNLSSRPLVSSLNRQEIPKDPVAESRISANDSKAEDIKRTAAENDAVSTPEKQEKINIFRRITNFFNPSGHGKNNSGSQIRSDSDPSVSFSASKRNQSVQIQTPEDPATPKAIKQFKNVQTAVSLQNTVSAQSSGFTAIMQDLENENINPSVFSAARHLESIFSQSLASTPAILQWLNYVDSPLSGNNVFSKGLRAWATMLVTIRMKQFGMDVSPAKNPKMKELHEWQKETQVDDSEQWPQNFLKHLGDHIDKMHQNMMQRNDPLWANYIPLPTPPQNEKENCMKFSRKKSAGREDALELNFYFEIKNLGPVGIKVSYAKPDISVRATAETYEGYSRIRETMHLLEERFKQLNLNCHDFNCTKGTVSHPGSSEGSDQSWSKGNDVGLNLRI
jgi:hypothetical protein